MARQKCVMNAMLQQLSPRTVITKFEDIAAAGEQLITTDLPASELGTFAELAMKTRTQPVSSVSFVPPVINTGDPDIEKIHAMVERAIAKAEGKTSDTKPAAAKKRKGFSRAGSSTVGGSIGSYAEGYAANKANDLSSAC
jgi:hypothetical protein